MALYYTCNTFQTGCNYQLCVACAEVVEDCSTVQLPAPQPKPKPPAVTNPFFEPQKKKAAQGGGISKPQGKGGKKKKKDRQPAIVRAAKGVRNFSPNPFPVDSALLLTNCLIRMRVQVRGRRAH